MRFARCFAAMLIVGVLIAGAKHLAAQTPAKMPNVIGEWTGTWSANVPDMKGKKYDLPAKALDCNVVLKDGVWQATFEGECGRPYKYTIKMEGREAGGAVLFKGTADLGPKDGGIYDWIGRANEQEFIGFYTNAKYTGTFKLTRKK